MKYCNGCKTEKPLESFHKRTYKSGKIATHHVCKECMKIAHKIRYAEKADQIKKTNKDWRDRNKDYYRKRFDDNRDFYLNNLREWGLKNPGARNARTKQRRVRAKDAFVPWADATKMKSIYAIAKFLTDVVGVPYHVDHIIPLQGKLVSGLHVENNLSVVRADINLRKGNKYEPI